MRLLMKDNLCTVYKLLFHRMGVFLERNGHIIVSDLDDADWNLVGLCAAFEADERRSLGILQSVGRNCKPVVAFGCLTRVRPDLIPPAKPFASWQAERLVGELVSRPFVPWKDIPLPTEFRCREDYRVYNPRKRFLGITTGCSFECSYCPHKVGAGNIRSEPAEEVLRRVEALNSQSIETVVITGIDTACYGKDTGSTFASLLKSILCKLRQDVAIQVAQFNPQGLRADGDLLRKSCSDDRLIDFQLPIQTSSPRLLRLMRRNYNASQVADFIYAVRKNNPNIFFRTDLMVGFPTETEEEFRQGVDYATENFDEVAVYGFEYKESTPLSKMGLSLLPDWEVKGRMEEATSILRKAGRIVHSGAQHLETLAASDQKKEAMRNGKRGSQ